jgi:hypothetical protein
MSPGKVCAVWGRGSLLAPDCVLCGSDTSEGVVVDDGGTRFVYAVCDGCWGELEIGKLVRELLPTETLSRDYELASAEVAALRARLEGVAGGGA